VYAVLYCQEFVLLYGEIMASIENISLQKPLFPVGQSTIVDEEGYLTNDVISQIHEIDLNLRKKDENLSDLTRISKHTWGSWLRKRRRPTDAGLTVLTLLMTQPEFVLNTLQSGRTAYGNEIAA